MAFCQSANTPSGNLHCVTSVPNHGGRTKICEVFFLSHSYYIHGILCALLLAPTHG